MGLAGEMQWSLLPPLTFACAEVTIAAALEPAYEVAGDTVDYAVDAGVARFAVLDGTRFAQRAVRSVGGRGLPSRPAGRQAIASCCIPMGSPKLLPEFPTSELEDALRARSPSGEFFGEQRLVDLIVRQMAAGLPAPETMRRVVRALLEHEQGRLTDDASLVLISWWGPLEPVVP
jgi:hypothetical protein